jgi:hypothetical protein
VSFKVGLTLSSLPLGRGEGALKKEAGVGDSVLSMHLLLALQPSACHLVAVARRGGSSLGFSAQGGAGVATRARRWIGCCVAMGMDTAVAGPQVVKAASDKRLYEVLKLENGLTALLIHDPAMSGLQPDEEGGCGRGGACGHDHEHDDDEEDDEDYEEGEEEEEEEDEDEDDDEDDGGMEVDGGRGLKRDHAHVHKGCCSNGTRNDSLLCRRRHECHGGFLHCTFLFAAVRMF